MIKSKGLSRFRTLEDNGIANPPRSPASLQQAILVVSNELSCKRDDLGKAAGQKLINLIRKSSSIAPLQKIEQQAGREHKQPQKTLHRWSTDTVIS